MYTKNAGSSEGAVWERPGFTATLRLADLTHNNPIDYALFEYYPGIMVRVSKYDKEKIDISCYKNVAAYCAEFIKPGFGVMEVSREHRDIYFKFEVPIRENALSESTIEALEKRAEAVIEQHRENLSFLANTYVPYKKYRALIQHDDALQDRIGCNRTDASLNIHMFNDSLDSIRNHLEKHSNHNTVAEGVDTDGNPTWKCEIFTGRDHYFLDLSVDRYTGMLIMKAMDGPKSIHIDTETRREVSAYLAEISSIRKVGYLWGGNETEGICCITNASLVDGIVGGETIELMEGLMIKSLDDARAKAYELAYGEEIEDDEKSFGTSRLDMLHKMFGKEDDDDSDDNDNPRMPLGEGHSINFSSMMADVLAHARSAREDQEDHSIGLMDDDSEDFVESDEDEECDPDNSDDESIADGPAIDLLDNSRISSD